MGLGFAAFGAELPELEARCHERLHYARPTVLAATEDPQGTRVLNLFARDWYPRYWKMTGWPTSVEITGAVGAAVKFRRCSVRKRAGWSPRFSGFGKG